MKNKFIFIFIVVLSIIPVLSLFHSGFPVTHDGQDHVARIANFYLNLTDGNIIPRWAPNLNWGYGHPILEFLYPLPSYFASFFHFLGFSLVDSTKIVFGLGMFLSLPFMYLWLSQFTAKNSAIFGAILYTYAPYRFVELYVRGDIGENLAFPLIPLVLYFIYKLYKEKNIKYLFLGGFSLAFLILAHNAVSLMIMPFILIYSGLLLYLSKNRKYLFSSFLFFFILGFSLSAFFWIPAFLEGKYTLRNIVTAGSFLGRFVNLNQIIYGPWSYGITGQFTVQFGVFQWLSLILSPIALYKFRKNKEKYFLSLILLFVTIFSTFLMFQFSGLIWEKIILLQNFQFPWRFLAMIVFSTSVLGALVFELIPKKYSLKLLLILTFLILIISSFYWMPRAYQYKKESFYSGIYKSTTDTGESSPIWSVRFMEKEPKKPLEIIDGNALVKELKRNSTEHIYQVKVNKDTLFAENTLYFPGWEIMANKIPLNIEFQNMSYRGVMLFHLPKGKYHLDVVYKETKLRAIADSISIVVLFNIIGFSIFRFVKPKFS
ncbi:MAG TPA: 6-pyruvoyl-tetrahydropterin synthase-related protein [Candidatus Sulfotelmatobacter sp.]|nr:6-pyruvoyl-tetrahydropterin synthase-related protein [Candidatus Sulfotelmatobacter sp.]